MGTVVQGSYANFSVWPLPLEEIPNCRTPAPSNAVNPPEWSSPVDPGPIYYESGTNGSCSFMATQVFYGLAPYEPSSASNPGSQNVSVSFMVSYG